MALLINYTLSNEQGFKTSKSLAFVEFIFSKNERNYANLMFFASKNDFQGGKNSFVPEELPGSYYLNVPSNVFWGNSLILQIHNYLKTEIEKVTGANTVTIIQDPYS